LLANEGLINIDYQHPLNGFGLLHQVVTVLGRPIAHLLQQSGATPSQVRANTTASVNRLLNTFRPLLDAPFCAEPCLQSKVLQFFLSFLLYRLEV
jgi:hypothetical protein